MTSPLLLNTQEGLSAFFKERRSTHRGLNRQPLYLHSRPGADTAPHGATHVTNFLSQLLSSLHCAMGEPLLSQGTANEPFQSTVVLRAALGMTLAEAVAVAGGRSAAGLVASGVSQGHVSNKDWAGRREGRGVASRVEKDAHVMRQRSAGWRSRLRGRRRGKGVEDGPGCGRHGVLEEEEAAGKPGNGGAGGAKGAPGYHDGRGNVFEALMSADSDSSADSSASPGGSGSIGPGWSKVASATVGCAIANKKGEKKEEDEEQEDEDSWEVEALEVVTTWQGAPADRVVRGCGSWCPAMPNPLIVVPSLTPLTRMHLHAICDELGLWHRTLHGVWECVLHIHVCVCVCLRVFVWMRVRSYACWLCPLCLYACFEAMLLQS